MAGLGYLGNHGYREFEVRLADGRRQKRLVHREVCAAFNGAAPFAGAVARHKDGTRVNNHHSNLEWGSKRDNTHDAMRHGTFPRGERCGAARLTERQVRDVRSRLAAGETAVSIAAPLGVDPATIGAIKRGKSWGWLT